MNKFHVKRGDNVVVIAGNHKGRRGRVLYVHTRKESVLLEPTDEKSKLNEERERLIAPRLHYRRKSQQHPNGAMVWMPGPVHVSNVMRVEDYEARTAKRK